MLDLVSTIRYGLQYLFKLMHLICRLRNVLGVNNHLVVKGYSEADSIREYDIRQLFPKEFTNQSIKLPRHVLQRHFKWLYWHVIITFVFIKFVFHDLMWEAHIVWQQQCLLFLFKLLKLVLKVNEGLFWFLLVKITWEASYSLYSIHDLCLDPEYARVWRHLPMHQRWVSVWSTIRLEACVDQLTAWELAAKRFWTIVEL